jgi:Pentapeptide repeats (8 copies)
VRSGRVPPHRYGAITAMSDKPSSPARKVDWRGADMRGAAMANLDLEHADLRACDLRGVNFTGSNLRYADLRGASVQGACFRNASLYGAKLQGIEANQADFRGCDLRQANLGGAYLDGAMFPPPERQPSPAEIAGRQDTPEKPWDERLMAERKGNQDGNPGNGQNDSSRGESLPDEQRAQSRGR